MTHAPLRIVGQGLVTSVGLSAAATGAAVRAGLTNPMQTRFVDSAGEWIQAHGVTLDQPWTGLSKLAKMAVWAIRESLRDIAASQWMHIPLLLCLAEHGRAGRTGSWEDAVLAQIEQDLATSFARHSALISNGKVGVCTAIGEARRLLADGAAPLVLIAAVDSLIDGPTLDHFEGAGRILTARNSDAFMPGEGAAAMLLASSGGSPVAILGVGQAIEEAHLTSEKPLRADGLTAAFKEALADAGCSIDDCDFRIADLSGEQYYFKEASLALSRTQRTRRAERELWHPAEVFGEAGCAGALACFLIAERACRMQYAPGPMALLHFANDAGERGAAVMGVR
jgi:3-oxoacyl-[acyl-carrier-protein] synthase I